MKRNAHMAQPLVGSCHPCPSATPVASRVVMKLRIPITRAQAAQLFPPVLAAFVSCLFIVIRPIAALSPPYSFLILTIQILYFYPSGTLVAQVESSALAFVGALFSLGYSNLFLWFAVLANRGHGGGESVWARVACALGLAMLAVSSESALAIREAKLMMYSGMDTFQIPAFDERSEDNPFPWRMAACRYF